MWLPICLHQIQLDRRLIPCHQSWNNYAPRSLFLKIREHHQLSIAPIWSRFPHCRGVLRIPWCSVLVPNIIGGVSTDGEYGADIFKISSINGAFVSGATVMGWSTTATQKGVTTNTSWLRLNASKSNGIYSKSNTVQSAALQILIIIKIWSALFLNSVPLNNAFTADASNLICIWELLP